MDYLHYLDVVKLRSPRTINGYYLDLRGFFRYMMMVWNLAQPDTTPEEIDLTHITKRQISTITKRDIINYLDYARSNDNGAKARARKLSALRGFFGYLCHQINELSENPTDNINLGSPKKSLPKYLSASESIRLLKNIQSDFYERDYCIIVSKKTGRRLTARRVEQIVANCLKSAGLDNMGYSPHKLRHTAATLMYQGGVDMLAIKEILGHENVSTTQIYTHINQQQLKQAVEASPLADTGYIAPQSKAMTDSKQDTGEEDS